MGSSLKRRRHSPERGGGGVGGEERREGWGEGRGEASCQDDSSFKLAPFHPTARLRLAETAFTVSRVIDQA